MTTEPTRFAEDPIASDSGQSLRRRVAGAAARAGAVVRRRRGGETNGQVPRGHHSRWIGLRRRP